jgi:hypothetical protein
MPVVSRPSLATTYVGMTQTTHSSASALVRHRAQVMPKSVSNEGHFTLRVEIVSGPYLATHYIGVTHTHQIMLLLPSLDIHGKFGLNRAVTKCTLLLMVK